MCSPPEIMCSYSSHSCGTRNVWMPTRGQRRPRPSGREQRRACSSRERRVQWAPRYATPPAWSTVYQLCPLFNDLVQDCGISIALAMEIPQSCTKPLNFASVAVFFTQKKFHTDNTILYWISPPWYLYLYVIVTLYYILHFFNYCTIYNTDL